MVHIILPGSNWRYSTFPFPAYRSELVYGDQRDAEFLAVKGVRPVQTPEGVALLPKNAFRVVRTRKEGLILVVEGRDETPRCLLFAGCATGFSMVDLYPAATTATILKTCVAGNKLRHEIQVIAILDVGQRLAFRRSSREKNEILSYLWTGSEISGQVFLQEEWDQRDIIMNCDNDVDVL